MKRIQSWKHKLGANEIDKISLSCFDDKRYVLDDGIHTLSYFHKNSVKSCNNLWLFYWWLLLMIIDYYYYSWLLLTIIIILLLNFVLLQTFLIIIINNQ